MKAKFIAELEFNYTDEYDYCEVLKEIIERGRELASFEVIGSVLRTNDDDSRIKVEPQLKTKKA